MTKNKRDWEQISSRKGKRYVERGGKHRKSESGRSPKRSGTEVSVQKLNSAEQFSTGGEMPENAIVGRNPVMEALRNDREIEKILVSGSAEGSIVKIVAMARDKGIPVYQSDRSVLDRISVGGANQGVIAFASAYRYSSLEEIYAKAEAAGEPPLVVILDNLEDPHNLGAIMRTAECAGAHGVIIPKRRACGLTETVARASAGAIEYMPCVRVANISRVIDRLKDDGFWIAACDMDGQPYYRQDLRGKLAVVIGSEGAGISQLVKKKCDFTVSMPMKGQITSLNASNAAAVLLYEVRKQRDDR